jgi:hypothetical protein
MKAISRTMEQRKPIMKIIKITSILTILRRNKKTIYPYLRKKLLTTITKIKKMTSLTMMSNPLTYLIKLHYKMGNLSLLPNMTPKTE